ncbi:MAG: hypothetical protein FWG79_08115 [Bacteroidales bacterium]|nr:hypothetical protein [Bacteroidales bacterium]
MKKITYFASIALIGLTLIVSCQKDMTDPIFSPDSSKAIAPVMGTVTDITFAAATLTATITDEFDPLTLMEKGFEVTTDPTFGTVTADRNVIKITRDTGVVGMEKWSNPEFSISTTNADYPIQLTFNTTYYVRAYTKTSGAGTTFGTAITFTTADAPTSLNLEGDLYGAITISDFTATALTMLDLDGDEANWTFAMDLYRAVGLSDPTKGFLVSYVYNPFTGDVYAPENYLCMPPIKLETIEGPIEFLLSDLAWILGEAWENTFKIVISEEELTLANAKDAEVLLEDTFDEWTIASVEIPAKYEGKYVYIALVHFDAPADGVGMTVEYISINENASKKSKAKGNPYVMRNFSPLKKR